MKVGIFGGTFDPIHNGHLRVAEEVRELFSLNILYFIPVYTPPHKRDKFITDTEHRVNMIRLAIRGNRFLRLSDIEIKRGGISYSFDTVCFFEKKYGDIYFIIGMDAFLEIDTWHRYKDIFFHTNFIVMVRSLGLKKMGIEIFPEDMRHEVRQIDQNMFQHTSGRYIYLQNITQLDISSTKIRELSLNNRSIRYLLPERVENYINKRGLYRK
ncbi:MAG: nicotinate-nucleotide adenylyltransferase [Syntrophorhabdaceae bacterium]|nr:nicotinate-nucleotide adenylyltransferase [Syntrophorhabdaceae bacterium]